MYARWIGKNVDLDLLISTLEVYLKEKGFKVKKSTLDNERIITCKIPHMPKNIEIVVEGNSQDFSVEASFVSEGFSSLIPHLLYSLFTGGYFLLNEIKMREVSSNIEKDFKIFFEHAVFKLANYNKS
ncbi:hypothetical protein HXY33_03515 [Candidatus Bathyarchaeota archaeon]|nr:hypothetical protein [Candidatus Bathyarchaeota archaeon]